MKDKEIKLWDRVEVIVEIGFVVLFFFIVWIGWTYMPNDEWKPWMFAIWWLSLGAFYKGYSR